MRIPGCPVSIIIPTYNEKENIASLLKKLYALIDQPLEVIIVDDDSPDGTAQLVEGLRFPNLRLIKRRSRGLASAVRRGVLASKGEIIGLMDADLTMPPSIMNQLISNLDQVQIALASRYVDGGSDNRSRLRVLASRAVNWLARLLLGDQIRDHDSGFVAFRREVLDHVDLSPSGHGEYFIEFVYDACKAGIKIKEVGYAFCDRRSGASKSAGSLLGFFALGVRYITRILSVRFHSVGSR
jgi:dolichol-phosphate mannosyltransferase